MTGRGRPRKEKSPDTKCAERQNGTTKERKPKEKKKTKPAEEKPSVQSKQKERTTKHFKEEPIKEQRTSTDNTKAPVQDTKDKTFAGRGRTTEQSEEIAKPETPKNTTKDSLKTTKSKTRGGNAKSPEQFAEQTPQDTTKDLPKTTKAKTRGGKAKTHIKVEFAEETLKHITDDGVQIKKPKTRTAKVKPPEQFAGEIKELQPEAPEDTAIACVPQGRCDGKAPVDFILNRTLENLKIRMNDRSDAAQVINKIIAHIIEHLKQNTQVFQEVQELRTGSYYENLKISNPDEFDVMLAFPVERVTVTPFGDDGAFYSVALKRGKTPLQKFQKPSTLSASEMLKEFRDEVKKCVKIFTEWKVTKKKKGCPAVTLITQVQSVTISLDVVLSLMVKSSWPPFTKEGLKIEGWLGTKVKQEYKRMPYYLVPKYEGKGTVENDGVLAKDVWRISFSHVEKAILMNHGSEKTCCEKGGERCCRKSCLKLLKHLLSLLKENDSSFDKFYSYHAKTTLLHACCSRTKDSEWKALSLSYCFQLLLEDFVAHLERGELHNFFIPTQNLLSRANKKTCDSLARRIREECDMGFPIFR